MRQSLAFGLRQVQRVAQSLKLTHAQRILVQSHAFELRMGLVEALREERYKPQAKCPSCNRVMSPVEIINGFNRDPEDFTTGCTKCGNRFQPKLICFGRISRIELPFYCDVQTTDQLRGSQGLTPQELSFAKPALYRSAIVHYGGIRRAFESIGIEYPFEEISDWRNKITPFLGRLPDTVIAQNVDVSVGVISRLRKKLGVKRYTLKTSLEEIE